MLRNEKGQHLDAADMYVLLGFGKRLPKEGMNPIVVHGPTGDSAMFACEPANQMQGRGRGGMKHRLTYWCGFCRIWVPVGRAGQHKRGREHKLNHEIAVGRP